MCLNGVDRFGAGRGINKMLGVDIYAIYEPRNYTGC